jgi:hypothetical protein
MFVDLFTSCICKCCELRILHAGLIQVETKTDPVDRHLRYQWVLPIGMSVLLV